MTLRSLYCPAQTIVVYEDAIQIFSLKSIANIAIHCKLTTCNLFFFQGFLFFIRIYLWLI